MEERDVEDALEKALDGQVERQKSLVLDGWSGRVGPVDLQVSDPNGRSLLEVKCGGDCVHSARGSRVTGSRPVSRAIRRRCATKN